MCIFKTLRRAWRERKKVHWPRNIFLSFSFKLAQQASQPAVASLSLSRCRFSLSLKISIHRFDRIVMNADRRQSLRKKKLRRAQYKNVNETSILFLNSTPHILVTTSGMVFLAGQYCHPLYVNYICGLLERV